jgi:tetratricopeptide (TPR) repeat protein
MLGSCRVTRTALVWLSLLAISTNTTALRSQDSATAQSFESQRFQAMLRAGDYNAAEKMVLESPEVAKDDVLMLPWLKLKQGKTGEGVSLLKRRVNDATQDRGALACHAMQVLADSSVEDAIAMGSEWLGDSGMIDVHNRIKLMMARLYLRSNQPDLARPLVDEGLEQVDVSESLKDVVFSFVLHLYQAGEPNESLRYFETLRSRFPETRLEPGYQLQWAHIATAAGKPLVALKTLDRVTTEYPDYFRSNEVLFRISKGLAFEKIGSRDDAKVEFTAAVDLSRAAPSQADIARAKLKEFAQHEESLKLAAAARSAAAEESHPPMTRNSSLRSRLLIVANGIAVVALVVWWLRRRGSWIGAKPKPG